MDKVMTLMNKIMKNKRGLEQVISLQVTKQVQKNSITTDVLLDQV